jgi:hypothetical protein
VKSQNTPVLYPHIVYGSRRSSKDWGQGWAEHCYCVEQWLIIGPSYTATTLLFIRPAGLLSSWVQLEWDESSFDPIEVQLTSGLLPPALSRQNPDNPGVWERSPNWVGPTANYYCPHTVSP